MSKRYFLFVDESGDTGTSTKYYAEMAFQIAEGAIPNLVNHMMFWRYVSGMRGELRCLPKNDELKRYLQPIHKLYVDNFLYISSVFLVKERYSGPYLRATSPRGQNHKRFRNFIHRQLLEFHFSICPLRSSNIEIVFDRFEMSKGDLDNLEDYLKSNWNLCKMIGHICHVDSLYTEPIQLVSQLVNRIGDIAMNRCDPEAEELLRSMISIKDITEI